MRSFVVIGAVLAGIWGCTGGGGGGGDEPPVDMGPMLRDMRLPAMDAGDGEPPTDAGPMGDGPVEIDAAPPMDAALNEDGAPTIDAMVALDALVEPDAETGPDAAIDVDAAVDVDAGPLGDCHAAVDPRPNLQLARDGRYLRVMGFPSNFVGPRALTILLPAAYDAEPARRFPVMYMHDGQNLFDPAAAAFGVEWQVDETVDRLVAAGRIAPVIIVGVHNTADRIAEYTPSRDAGRGEGGLAAEYGRFLVDELKPFIDARLRTRCERVDTGLGGSSLGGLVSLYLWREYPDVFGRIASVSPSYWWNDREAVGWVPALLDARREGVRVWIDAGNAEGGDEDGDGWTSVVEDARAVFEGLVEGGLVFPDEVALQEDADGQHNERTWADRLPALMVWLWGEGPGAAQRLSIRLPFPTLLVGATTPVSVDARYLGDVWLTMPRMAPQLESSDPAVLRVQGAAVEAVAAGEATLTARFGDLETTFDVAVVDAAHTPIEVRVPPETPADAMIWVAGDLATLGTWRADGVLLEAAGDGRYAGLLEIPPGAPFEYKITRGTWETVEKGPDGEEIENRRGIGGEPQRAEVVRWRDLVP